MIGATSSQRSIISHIVSGSRLYVPGLISPKTEVSPACLTTFALEMSENVVALADIGSFEHRLKRRRTRRTPPRTP